MSMIPCKGNTRVRADSGYTLLEVMVALVIFSIGLLGLAGLESQSLRYNHSAYLRTQASYLAYDILDRMRANRATALNNNYNANFTSTGTNHNCDTATATCSTIDMAQHDIYEWKQQLAALPGGEGQVTRSGDLFTITIRWDDPGVSSNGSNYKLSSEL